jgi:hypothetical protein
MEKRWGENAAHIAQLLNEIAAVGRLGDLPLLPYLQVVVSAEPGTVEVVASGLLRIRLSLESSGRSSATTETWSDQKEAIVVDISIEDE